MDTFNRLAELLDATVGGSRAVVDDGKLPRERQVGATGQIKSQRLSGDWHQWRSPAFARHQRL